MILSLFSFSFSDFVYCVLSQLVSEDLALSRNEGIDGTIPTEIGNLVNIGECKILPDNALHCLIIKMELT